MSDNLENDIGISAILTVLACGGSTRANPGVAAVGGNLLDAVAIDTHLRGNAVMSVMSVLSVLAVFSVLTVCLNAIA